MTQRMDQIVYSVQVGGVDISDKVQRIDLKWDFAQRISEATVELTEMPDSVDYWQNLVVTAGMHSTGGDTQSDILGYGVDGIPRFNGFVVPLGFSLWPTVPKITGRGPLILAERLVCPDDAEEQHQSNPLYGPDDYKYDAPGMDLSANPDTLADWMDSDMVTWLLGQCGLASRIDPVNGIGGVGRLLGTIAPESFTWRRGASALSFIEDLDKIGLGYRTFERLDGVICRAQTSPRTPFLDNRITFTEGDDILDDGNLNRSAVDEKNRVVVTGFDGGGGPESFVLVGAISNPPPGVLYQTDTTSSPMIELSFKADVAGGAGISCEDVALWRQQEVSSEIVEVTFSTWRDDALSPGDTVYVNSPHIAINQSLWATGVGITVEGGEQPSFTQRITARSVALRDRKGVPTLPLVLPAPLFVGMGIA